MTFLRFVMLLALVVWIGGIIFFASVVAPTVFSVLPTRALAGAVVSRSLTALHYIGLVSGVVFLVASMLHSRLSSGSAEPLATRHVLVFVMLLITLYAQFGLGARMLKLRDSMGQIDSIAQTDSRRIEFNRLHHWSTRLEGTVLFLGLGVLYLASRRLS
jgi:hypothetical protein